MFNYWVISHYQHFWHYLHWKHAPHCRNRKPQPHHTAGNENRNCIAPQWFIQMTTATALHHRINEPQLHRTAAHSHALHRKCGVVAVTAKFTTNYRTVQSSDVHEWTLVTLIYLFPSFWERHKAKGIPSNDWYYVVSLLLHRIITDKNQ